MWRKIKNIKKKETKNLDKAKNPQCIIIYKKIKIEKWQEFENLITTLSKLYWAKFSEKGGSVGKWKFPIL